jgi:hypothetical protein
MKIKVSDILESIAENLDYSFRDNYSGRGMFGRTCMGISGESVVKIVEQAAQSGIVGAKVDNMGCNYIVYWPNYKIDEEIDEVELVTMEDAE